jgi:hypothetical protein
VNIYWHLLFVNFRNNQIRVSISNDSSLIRNRNYIVKQENYPVFYNTDVERLDSEQLRPLTLNPGDTEQFLLRYRVWDNNSTQLFAEGRNQFFERIGIDSSAIVTDSVFINLYRFPEDSIQQISNAYYPTGFGSYSSTGLRPQDRDNFMRI